MSVRRRILVATGFALLAGAAAAGCVTTNPYAPQTRPGDTGYSEQRIDESHWRVEFVGDEAADAAIVERNLLFRAAQLTQTSGYDWFRPSAHQAYSDTEIVVEAPRPLANAGVMAGWRPAWRRRGALGWSDWRRPEPMPLGNPVSPPSHDLSFVRYSARETIEMGHGEKPPNAFDAAAVAQLLRSAVEPR